MRQQSKNAMQGGQSVLSHAFMVWTFCRSWERWEACLGHPVWGTLFGAPCLCTCEPGDCRGAGRRRSTMCEPVVTSLLGHAGSRSSCTGGTATSHLVLCSPSRSCPLLFFSCHSPGLSLSFALNLGLSLTVSMCHSPSLLASPSLSPCLSRPHTLPLCLSISPPPLSFFLTLFLSHTRPP